LTEHLRSKHELLSIQTECDRNEADAEFKKLANRHQS